MTKLFIAVFSAVAIFSFCSLNFEVNADSTAIAKVVITSADIKDCTIFGLDFGDIDVSIYDQEYERSGNLHCTFLTSSGIKLTYQWDGSLSSQNYTIPNSAVSIKARNLTNIQWNLNAESSLANYHPFDIPLTVYWKDEGTVWEMDQEIDFRLTVPGGTPAWEYAWVFILTIQPQ